MSKIITDRDVLEAIRKERLVEHGYSAFQYDKWVTTKRGIPWKERARVAGIARKLRVKLPADFLFEQRREAA